jgi:DNA-binding NtrC family response regulator
MCQVDVATTKAQAQQLLLANRYHVVVTDYQLCDGCGLELAAFHADSEHAAGVVLMSACVEAPWAKGDECSKLSAVLRKPFTIADFLGAVEAAIQNAGGVAGA